MSHTHEDIEFTQEFWDDRYRSAGQLWSGQPNLQLVAQAAGLAAGTALDAGCGGTTPLAPPALLAAGGRPPGTPR